MNTLEEKIEIHFNQKLPFAVYSKPNLDSIIGVFQKNKQTFLLENFEESGFAFISFDGKTQIFIPKDESTIIQEKNHFNVNIENLLNDIDDCFESQKDFENLVALAIDTIKNKGFEKVVLSRKESFQLDKFQLLKTIQTLFSKYPETFRYVFFHPNIGLWLGATPEKFLERKENHLKTMALAGTQLFSKEVHWTSKEINEQKIVTDFISSQLHQHAQKVTISKPFTFQAGNLAHIRTDIEADIENDSLKNIIEELHPTPAVCGMPKENAKEFILENEGYDREFYTGFLGELNMNVEKSMVETDLFVNLRCMKVENKTVSIFVGCGITADSNPTHEFLETVNKSKTIKNIIVS